MTVHFHFHVLLHPRSSVINAANTYKYATNETCFLRNGRLCRTLKGHSQLMHMRIRYHFLVDLHVTRHWHETESAKRIQNTQNKPCRVKLVTRPNCDYRP